MGSTKAAESGLTHPVFALWLRDLQADPCGSFSCLRLLYLVGRLEYLGARFLRIKESHVSKKLAVLVSGTGSIMRAIIEAGIPITAVFADQPCEALKIAEAAGIQTVLIDRTKYGFPTKGWDRDGFSAEVARRLKMLGIDLAAMAGWMTVLSQPMFDEYAGRILNTHPALLPSFPGAHGARDALAYGVKISGCTIHWAILGVDAGPIIDQAAVRVRKNDTPDTLQERIKKKERKLYPKALKDLMAV